jgi:phosphotransferase system enzyme I (PtsI)
MDEEYAKIFEAHLLVLEDPFFIVEVTRKIREELVNVEYALWEVLQGITKDFSSLSDDYIRERAIDIYDVGRRILQNLMKSKKVSSIDLQEDVIVVAHNLTPSDTAQMHKKRVIGFATDVGGRTSHTAILARALEIPAVVGLEDVTSLIRRGDTLIVDGNQGRVIINPDAATLRKYQEMKQEYESFVSELDELRDLPAVTKDGYRIELSSNIEIPEEIELIKKHGADGIGLYRTEFLYLDRDGFPSEEEQMEAYSRVASAMKPLPVIIRTLDLGGDKFSGLTASPELNPFLGLRAIRFCLDRVDVFKQQLRAILRASVYGNLKIMFPMISGVEELRQAKRTLEEVKSELRDKGIPFNEEMEVGIMIEIPSAAISADILAKEVDFFSIGTNDLIQYALAVDRGNEKVAYLYDPLHPGVLRLIRQTIEAAHREGKWVGMCGEMAGDPLFSMILIGLGLDEFSVSGVAIPEIKEIIRSIDLVEARALAREALKLTSSEEIRNIVSKKFSDSFIYKKLEEIK